MEITPNSSPSTDASHRLVGLDLIRATAILAVLVCHYLFFFFHANWQLAAPFGLAGVEIFFVLSGYLIGGILLDVIARNGNRLTPPLLLNFWMRRWLRTVPNYVLALAVFTVLQHYHPYHSLLPYLTFTQNLFHPVPPFFDLSWSLAVEEWFYLLFPILILGFGFTRWPMRYRFLAATAILFVGPVVARIVWGTGTPWDLGVRKTVAMRLDAVMWGVLVAAMRRYAGEAFRRLQSPWFLAAGLALLIGVLAGVRLRYAPDGDFTSTWGDAFWFSGLNLACALTLPFCAGMRSLPRPLRAVVERTSLWSYSMYLFHEPVLWQSARMGNLALPWVISLTTVGIFAVSAAAYHFFELPILGLRDRLFAGSGPRATPAPVLSPP